MAWTDEQLAAINTGGKNMLVSAAAGSGKTSVLVERIKRLIIDEGVSIDRILVVTFTNAAASEMKEKIVKAITAEIEKNPEDSKHLRRQLNLIHKANISTFHAFALEVIRRYFHVISMEPNFKICDEAQGAIMMGEAMEALFDELFEKGDKAFLEFLDRYATGKSFEQVKTMILELHRTMQSLPEPEKWVDEAVEALSDIEGLKASLSAQILGFSRDMLESTARAFAQTAELLRENGLPRLADKAQQDAAAIKLILTDYESKSFDDVRQAVKDFKLAVLAKKNDEKERFAEIADKVDKSRKVGKDILAALKKDFFSQDLGEQAELVRLTHPMASCLADMTKEFDRLFKAAKAEKGLIDFSDIEHLALEILKNEDVAAEYREKFEYIFIDEYQDSNLLQDSLVARIKRENNVFMVGDVKQCIYKFRLAEPEIFMEKYESYGRGEDENSIRLDLNTNFRCKGNIVKTVNAICLPLMADYENSKLNKGVAYEGELDYHTELYLVDTKAADDLPAEIRELKAAELEARNAAALIKKLLGQKISCIGADGSEEIREITYKDIVVLMRSTKGSADIFYQAFLNEGIPVYVDGSDGYFSTLEIEIFMNLLKVIDNRRQDLPLLSLLRTPFMGFSLAELARIRIHKKKCSYFEAFKSYAESGDDAADGSTEKRQGSDTDPVLRKKCADTLAKIADWKRLSRILPPGEFCRQLMTESGFLLYAGALPGGAQRQANLRALTDKALKFSEGEKGGLYAFINYVEALQSRGVPTGQVKMIGENDNVVRIMTIHKSKGLEFPVVILAGMGKRINTSQRSGSLSLHKDVGIGLRCVDLEQGCYHRTIMQTLVSKRLYSEQMEEEKRILYVALTRAKDRLIMSGTVHDAESAKEGYLLADPGISGAASCYLDFAAPTLFRKEGEARDAARIYIRDRQSFFEAETAETAQSLEKLRRLLSGESGRSYTQAEYDEISRRFSYEYPWKDELGRKAKYSVTELNEEGRVEPAERRFEERAAARPLSVPEFASGKTGFTAAERGTIMHTAFEHLDFSAAKPTLQYLRDYVAGLADREILTKEEADTINVYKLLAFLKSDLGRRACAARRVYKETPFNLLLGEAGSEILVQGIIDCYFEEVNSAGETEYVLVDYKTNYIGLEELETTDEEGRSAGLERMRRTYRKQIEVYRKALEEIKHIKVRESYLYLIGIERALKME